MPTVLRIGPYRFHFYSLDGVEPPHIHVRGPSGEAKFWLRPVRLARNGGYREHELRRMRAMVEEHEQELWDAWHIYFRNR